MAPDPIVTESPQCFVRFLSLSSKRKYRGDSVLAIVKRSGCNRVCAYSSRHKQVKNGAVMFLATFVSGPKDIMIYGRAVAREYQKGDDAKPADIDAAHDWVERYPHYIRVADAEFIEGVLGDGVSLNELMAELKHDAFKVTQAHFLAGQDKNTNPRVAYMREPHVMVTDEGYKWLNKRVEEAFEKHGKLAPAQLEECNWPGN